MTTETDDSVFVGDKDVIGDAQANLITEPSVAIVELKHWLCPASLASQPGVYQRHLKSRAKGTGRWVWETAQFQQWQESADISILRINGPSGSGKSVLATSLVERLVLEKETIPVLFIYLQDIAQPSRTPQNLALYLLCQLLEYSPMLQNELKEMKDENLDLRNMSFDRIWQSLTGILKSLDKVYCVIDGLCGMEDASEDFLDSLLLLSRQHPSKIKIVLSARSGSPLKTDIKDSSVLEIRLERKIVDKDIATYITNRLEGRWRPELAHEEQESVRHIICSKAQGIFLCACLMMDELALCDDQISRRQKLQELPYGLEDTYLALLSQYALGTDLGQSFQYFLLQLVAHSFRPLRQIEVFDVFKSLPAQNRLHPSKNQKSSIRLTCGPLLDILEDETIKVIHPTFTDFLLDSERKKGASSDGLKGSFPVIDSLEAHRIIAMTCIKYLNSDCFSSWSRDLIAYEHSWHYLGLGSGYAYRGRIETDIFLQFPFLKYAVYHWAHHAAKAGISEKLFLELDEFMQPQSHNFLSWLDLWGSSNSICPIGFSPLHVAAFAGLTEYTIRLLKTGLNLDCKDTVDRTPLSYACALGNSQIVSLLLGLNANPELDDKHGLYPIHYAAIHGHAIVTRTLLNTGVDPCIPKRKEFPPLPLGYQPSTIGETALFYSCGFGKTETIKELLKKVNPEHISRSPLQRAARDGRADILSLLLQSGNVDVNQKNMQGNTALFLAAISNDAATVSMLLQYGADVHLRSEDRRGIVAPQTGIGFTAVHGWATTSGAGIKSRDMGAALGILLEAGCDVDARDENGKTPLLLLMERVSLNCRKHKHVEPLRIASILLENSADPSTTDHDENTCLHLLRVNEECGLIKLLQTAGADINTCRRLDGMPPLHLAIHRQLHVYWTALLAHGANCNLQDSHGNTAIQILLSQGAPKVEQVMQLLVAGADPNVKNYQGNSSLLTYTDSSYYSNEVIQAIVSFGAELEVRRNNGRTALLCAAEGNKLSLAQELLRLGANANAKDFKGKTALHLLMLDQNIRRPMQNNYIANKMRCFNILLLGGADPVAQDYAGNTILHDVVESSMKDEQERLAIMQLILKAGVLATTQNHQGRTVVHSAAASLMTQGIRKDYCNALELLVDHSSNINVNARDYEGVQPLHLASCTSEYKVWKLLEAGADPICTAENGRTPLHFAARARQSNVIGILTQLYKGKSWSVDPVDDNGRTPLHYATRSGRIESVEFLLECGAKPTAKDKSGRTPLHTCAEYQEEANYWILVGSSTSVSDVYLHDPFRPLVPLPLSRPGHGPLRSIRNENESCRARDIVRALLAAGADPFELDNFEQTPYQVALRSMSEEVVEELSAIMEVLPLESQTLSKLPYKPLPWEDRFSDLWLRVGSQYAGELINGLQINVDRASDVLDYAIYLKNESLIDALLQKMANHSKLSSGMKALHTLARWGLVFLMEKIAPRVVDLRSSCLLRSAASRELYNLPMIKLLVNLGVDIDMLGANTVPDVGSLGGKQLQRHKRDSVNRSTALHLLAVSEYWWQPNALEYLLDAGADVEIKDGNGNTALQIAIISGGFWWESAFSHLLNRGVNVNAINYQGATAVSQAAERGADNQVRDLVHRGADISLGKWPAIFYAAYNSETAALKALLELGADPNSEKPSEASSTLFDDRPLVTPLQVCACVSIKTEKQRMDAAANMTLLLQHGADVSKVINKGDVVLVEIAKEAGLLEPLWPFRVNLEVRDSQGLTPLLAACSGKLVHVEALRIPSNPSAVQLLWNGAAISAVDNSQRNALHHLLRIRRTFFYESALAYTLDVLLEKGVSVNTKDAAGYTGLLYAAQHGYYWAIEKLLQAGADAPEPSLDGDTALHFLASDLFTSPKSGEVYARLLEMGMNPNARDKLGNTPLFNFVASTRFCSGDPNFLYSGGKPPARKFHREIVGILGGDIKVRNSKGETLLHWVAKERVGNEAETAEVFQMLLDLGLDPRVEDNNEMTPLDVAAERSHVDIVKIFSRHG